LNETSSFPTSDAWSGGDPLGLGIPLAGILGIIGYVFIDMGIDCR
jgi:hypothetical protein